MRGIPNLGAFVAQARRDGDLLEIDRPADPYLEVASARETSTLGTPS